MARHLCRKYLILNYIKMGYKEKLEQDTGFKFETNVREVFTEAETNDDVDIEELYRKLFREWHNDVKLVAELSMCMNRKIWEHHEKWNESLAELYNSLWLRVHDYALDVFTWEDGAYYFRVTD